MCSLLTGIFFLATAVQVAAWLLATIRLIRRLSSTERCPARVPAVSLLVCARDEAGHLQKHLPLWLAQDHPEFELIVVNDGSQDETGAVLDDFAAHSRGLRVIHRERRPTDLPGKKQALELAIQSARYDRLVLTDADCRPASSRWLRCMAAPFAAGNELVLGYAPLEVADNFLTHWARFETVHTAQWYLSAALWNRPYMGVGRNMAYHRALFRAQAGFAAHADLPGGDDDLLVSALPPDTPTAVVLHPEAWCWSSAPATRSAYRQQKMRHFQTGRRYRPVQQALLGGLALSQALHYLLLPIALFCLPWGALLAWMMRLLVVWYVAARIWPRLGARDLLPLLPLYDLGLVVYHALYSPYIFGWRRPKDW